MTTFGFCISNSSFSSSLFSRASSFGISVVFNFSLSDISLSFPKCQSNEISKKLGTRHRAAIGLREVSDAAVIVVSEETGVISLALNGKLVRNYDKERLKAILLKILYKKQISDQESIRKKVKRWVKEKSTTSS